MICTRCKKEITTHTIGFFNLDEICIPCSEEEKKHPLYKEAKEIELREVQNKNYNFEGVFSHLTWDEIKQQTSINV